MTILMSNEMVQDRRTRWVLQATTANDLIIYQGTLPSGDSFDLADHTSDILVTFSGSVIEPLYGTIDDDGNDRGTARISSTGQTATASATGTASWFSFVHPSNQRGIIGTVTLSGGDGAVKISTLSIVASNTITLIDFRKHLYYTWSGT